MATLSSSRKQRGSRLATATNLKTTPFDSELQTLKMASEANATQMRLVAREQPVQRKRRSVIGHGSRIDAIVVLPNDEIGMKLMGNLFDADDTTAVSSDINVPEVNGRGDLLIASAGVQFKKNLQGVVNTSDIIGIRQSTAFLLRLLEKNIGLVIGVNNRMDYDAMMSASHADFTRLNEGFSEITSGYLLPPAQEAEIIPSTRTWTLRPKYVIAEDSGGLQETTSLTTGGVAAAVATAVDNISHTLFGSGSSSTVASRPSRRPVSSAAVPTSSVLTAVSPTSPLIDRIDRVDITRELVSTSIWTEGDEYIGKYMSDVYFNPRCIQLSFVTFTIYGTRRSNSHDQQQMVEYTHHFLHVDIRCWADNSIPSISGSRYHRIVGKDVTMLNGYNEVSALIMLVNALVYVYGNGSIPLQQSPVRIFVNHEPLEARLKRIQNGSISTSGATTAFDNGRINTAGPTDRVLVHNGINDNGRTSVILTLLQYFSPFNPAPHSWLNIVEKMRGTLYKDKAVVIGNNVQWKFLQYYTDLFAFNSEWVTMEDPNMTLDAGTQGSSILPQVYLPYMLLGQLTSMALFTDRNEIFSILLRMYYTTLHVRSNVPYITSRDEADLVDRIVHDVTLTEMLSNDGLERMVQLRKAIDRVMQQPQQQQHQLTANVIRTNLSTKGQGGGGDRRQRRDYIKSLNNLNQVISKYASLTTAPFSFGATPAKTAAAEVPPEWVRQSPINPPLSFIIEPIGNEYKGLSGGLYDFESPSPPSSLSLLQPPRTMNATIERLYEIDSPPSSLSLPPISDVFEGGGGGFESLMSGDGHRIFGEEEGLESQLYVSPLFIGDNNAPSSTGSTFMQLPNTTSRTSTLSPPLLPPTSSAQPRSQSGKRTLPFDDVTPPSSSKRRKSPRTSYR